jgi:hypothetical protein
VVSLVTLIRKIDWLCEIFLNFKPDNLLIHVSELQIFTSSTWFYQGIPDSKWCAFQRPFGAILSSTTYFLAWVLFFLLFHFLFCLVFTLSSLCIPLIFSFVWDFVVFIMYASCSHGWVVTLLPDCDWNSVHVDHCLTSASNCQIGKWQISRKLWWSLIFLMLMVTRLKEIVLIFHFTYLSYTVNQTTGFFYLFWSLFSFL